MNCSKSHDGSPFCFHTLNASQPGLLLLHWQSSINSSAVRRENATRLHSLSMVGKSGEGNLSRYSNIRDDDSEPGGKYIGGGGSRLW